MVYTHVRGQRARWGQFPFVRFLAFALGGIGMSAMITPTVGGLQVIQVLCGLMAVLCLCMLLVPTPYFGPVFFLFILFLCWWRAWATHPAVLPAHFSHHTSEHLVGYIVDEPLQDSGRVRLRMRIRGGEQSAGEPWVHVVGDLQVTAEGDYDLSYGDWVHIPARYQRVPGPRNPGEMDYAAHLAKQNCWHQSYLREGELRPLKTVERAGSAFIAHSLQWRQKMVQKFSRFMPRGPGGPDEAYTIASTLILGYRAELSQELMETYSATGTIHVLSVSGMHVVIVFWLLAYLLFWMDYRRALKMLRFPFLLVAIWAYAFITGLSPSVLRAAMMLSFVLWATAGRRRSRTYNNIAASAFFLLLYDPKLLLNLGFQLSYLAVIGIVFLNPYLQKLLRRGPRLLHPVMDYSAMSVAAQAGASPLAMYYFQQFPLYFLLANLLIVLPATLIMYLGFAILLIPEWSVTTDLLSGIGWALSHLILWMNGALRWIQQLPSASLTGLAITWWQCFLIYVSMLSFVFALLHRSGRLLLLFLGLFVGLVASLQWRHYHRVSERVLTIHQLRSDLGISFTDATGRWFYTDLPSHDHRSFSYSIWPYLRVFGSLDAVQWISTGEDAQGPGWMIRENVLQIGDKRLVLVDARRGELREHPKPLDADLLLLRHNPRQSLREMLEQYRTEQVIVDGSNYPQTVERLQEEAALLGVHCYVLKDNFAYVWVMD